MKCLAVVKITESKNVFQEIESISIWSKLGARLIMTWFCKFRSWSSSQRAAASIFLDRTTCPCIRSQTCSLACLHFCHLLVWHFAHSRKWCFIFCHVQISTFFLEKPWKNTAILSGFFLSIHFLFLSSLILCLHWRDGGEFSSLFFSVAKVFSEHPLFSCL